MPVASDSPTIAGDRHEATVAVQPGKYWLWVAAIESASGARGSLLTEIDVPDFSRPRLSISGITMSVDGRPAARRAFDRHITLDLYCEIYGAHPDLPATLTVTASDGGVVLRSLLKSTGADGG